VKASGGPASRRRSWRWAERRGLVPEGRWKALADLEECLRLAQDAQLARESLADVRAALALAEARARALEAALLEAERRFCRWGEAAPCGLHALVRRALEGRGTEGREPGAPYPLPRSGAARGSAALVNGHGPVR
jgi:hypothetical protein